MPVATQAHPISKLVSDAAHLENVRAVVSGEAFHEFKTVRKSLLLTPDVLKALKDAGTAPSSPPIQPLPDTLDFNTGSITFSGGTPVGGWAHLKLYQNGNYEYSGHFHDAGAPSYDAGLVWIIVGRDGTAFSFVAQVHTCGTFEVGSRDGDWYQAGNNQQIAEHWADLTASWHYNWRAYVNWDYGIIIKQVEDALKVAGTVVGAVVAVVALV